MSGYTRPIKFLLGKVYVTPAAVEALIRNEEELMHLLKRHQSEVQPRATTQVDSVGFEHLANTDHDCGEPKRGPNREVVEVLRGPADDRFVLLYERIAARKTR